MTVAPWSLQWSVRWWLAAVGAGVLETAIHASTSPDYNAAVQLPLRAVIYLLAVGLIMQLRSGQGWARIALTVLLGGIGLLSLLAEPISWVAGGGSPSEFLVGAGAATLAIVVVRAAHVVAVLVALILMYWPVKERVA
jgi:hypothetical protein